MQPIHQFIKQQISEKENLKTYFGKEYRAFSPKHLKWHKIIVNIRSLIIMDLSLFVWSEAISTLKFEAASCENRPKWHVCPAKTQISLGICPVWSVFTVGVKKPWVLSYPLSAHWRLWSDWVDAQADLSLRWAHIHFVGFVMSRLN